jgi:hypothetical protein
MVGHRGQEAVSRYREGLTACGGMPGRSEAIWRNTIVHRAPFWSCGRFPIRRRFQRKSGPGRCSLSSSTQPSNLASTRLHRRKLPSGQKASGSQTIPTAAAAQFLAGLPGSSTKPGTGFAIQEPFLSPSSPRKSAARNRSMYYISPKNWRMTMSKKWSSSFAQR